MDQDGIPDECQPASPGQANCFGQNCPCGNNSPTGGCINSSGLAAQLTGTGVAYSEYVVCPSIAPPGIDTVTLTVTGAPPSAAGIIFRGTTNLNGGAGVLFGDGLRCCGGQVTRSNVQIANAAGTMSFGYPISKLSVKTLSCASFTYCYQAWFRDTDPFYCTSDLFNTSNAYDITWLP